MPAAPVGETLLLQHPALSAQHLAFAYTGDLWFAETDRSSPWRLTAARDDGVAPAFSPDGQHLAYSNSVAGSMNVYVLPVSDHARWGNWSP